MICLVLIFMTVKFMVLAQRKAPLITNATIPSHFDNSLEWSWAENGYRMAFGVQNYDDQSSKDSPDVVRWTPELITIKGDDWTRKPLGVHKCTEEDFERFNPVELKSKKMLT